MGHRSSVVTLSVYTLFEDAFDSVWTVLTKLIATWSAPRAAQNVVELSDRKA
jgi:hypothetical protein